MGGAEHQLRGQGQSLGIAVVGKYPGGGLVQDRIRGGAVGVVLRDRRRDQCGGRLGIGDLARADPVHLELIGCPLGIGHQIYRQVGDGDVRGHGLDRVVVDLEPGQIGALPVDAEGVPELVGGLLHCGPVGIHLAQQLRLAVPGGRAQGRGEIVHDPDQVAKIRIVDQADFGNHVGATLLGMLRPRLYQVVHPEALLAGEHPKGAGARVQGELPPSFDRLARAADGNRPLGEVESGAIEAVIEGEHGCGIVEAAWHRGDDGLGRDPHLVTVSGVRQEVGVADPGHGATETVGGIPPGGRQWEQQPFLGEGHKIGRRRICRLPGRILGGARRVADVVGPVEQVNPRVGDGPRVVASGGAEVKHRVARVLAIGPQNVVRSRVADSFRGKPDVAGLVAHVHHYELAVVALEDERLVHAPVLPGSGVRTQDHDRRGVGPGYAGRCHRHDVVRIGIIARPIGEEQIPGPVVLHQVRAIRAAGAGVHVAEPLPGGGVCRSVGPDETRAGFVGEGHPVVTGHAVVDDVLGKTALPVTRISDRHYRIAGGFGERPGRRTFLGGEGRVGVSIVKVHGASAGRKRGELQPDTGLLGGGGPALDPKRDRRHAIR